jgi:Protein of unknown function (DUF3617)
MLHVGRTCSRGKVGGGAVSNVTAPSPIFCGRLNLGLDGRFAAAVTAREGETEMLKRPIAFAFAMVMAVAARAEDVPGLQPGEYQVTVSIELPHVEDTGASRVATICVLQSDAHPTWGLVVLSDNNPLARCPASNVRLDGNTLTFDIICPGVNQATASARYTVSAQRFTGVIAMKMGGKNMTMTEQQVGHRIGNCKPA